MHGCSSGSALLVNAEVDSMGGVVDGGGGGIGTKPSPRRAAIKKAQAELRQEYDVREERRRQLEFLEKGGDPLDFKIRNAASVSAQSTSQTDQHPEQFVTSEAKGSFALTASPHGDSVESSGRPGTAPSVCEPNSADNLMLFDGENESREGERDFVRPSRSNIAPSEQSSQLRGGHDAKESGDSAAFGLPKKAYKRRNRSRPNRDGARSSSTDFVSSRSGHACSLLSRHPPRDAKGFVFVVDTQNERNVSSSSKSKPASPNANIVHKAVFSDSQLDMSLDDLRAIESTTGLTKASLHDADADADADKYKNRRDKQHNQLSQFDAEENPIDMASRKSESFGGREQVVLADRECPPIVVTEKVETQSISGQMNGFSGIKRGRKNIPNEGQNSAVLKKGLGSESSCTQMNLSLDGNNDTEMCTNLKFIDSNGNTEEQSLMYNERPVIECDELVKERRETKTDDICSFTNSDSNVHQFDQENGSVLKTEEDLKGNGLGLQNEVKDPIISEGMVPHCISTSEKERKITNLLGLNSTLQDENACNGALDSSIQEVPENTLSIKGCTVAPEQQICSAVTLKLENKAHEDTILEEARIIEAKRKRIAELSVGSLPLEDRTKSHWDFVLEEMAWLANDFAQERLWKITAAAQICRRAAFTSQLRIQEQNSHWKQKEVAHTLAKAVMEFWHSVEDRSKGLELQCPEKDYAIAVKGYAGRFLEYNSSHVQHGPAESPVTPDKIPDFGIVDISWEEHLTEENLFYTVSPGAMEAYRKSIESHLLQCERTGISLQEEVETSGYDAVADFGSQENAFEEDEGETSSYYLPGAFEGSKSSKFAQKKWKNSMKAYGARSYEVGSDFPFMKSLDNKHVIQQSVLIGKRPPNSLNVSFPTKRVRTASRQRIVSPFSAGTSGCLHAPSKTDASSGDTNSFQDDQSTLQGGSHIPNGLEVESLGDFEKQLRFDLAEVSNKPKNKRKAKHLGSTYEQRWQLDSNFRNEQRDHSKKRLEGHQLESNGSSGLFGQHMMKKPKMMRQSLDNSFDNINPIAGSAPSPVASQMSNMSNRNKFIKMLGGRERGRKTKALKMSAGQSGSGSTWSQFEDQALVVLVHDMGPNWEFVSDAINSTLHFKSIFRKPKECSERHKFLMDGTSGDGADSAEDSGSSQPYPSTLPGIPKGSARQLFQHLQGPMEEDTLKSHFEKIIGIGQKQHYRMTQEPKQLQQPHNSHTLALSQVCPNNLNGGPILTPLDLCDASASSPDVHSLSYQGPHTSALPSLNPGNVAPMLPASGVNSSLQGSSSVVLGRNFPSPSGPHNASIRDGRYGIPRTSSLTTDEQHRMQQYNQMQSGRNIQQSSLPVPDRGGVRMLPSGNGLGVVNRGSVPMVRPGFQGMASSSSMLSSGSMLSSMPSPVNMHSGAAPSQGNSMLRPRDTLHMMRPTTQNLEHQRQMIMPELQMQVSQGNSQGVSPFGGLGSSFSNQTAPSPVHSYPLHHHHHHQQPHPMSPQQPHVLSNSHPPPPHLQGPKSQHQAYAIRFAKESQLQQQRILQQQQQQFVPSNALMPQVQPQTQLPISTSPQNSSQIQSQASSPPVSLSPLAASSSINPMSQKHHIPPHGIGRNLQIGSTGLPNQMGKQRQRQQQLQQSGRHHPQQRQQPSQSHQQAKLLKGGGRGNVMVHQNLPMDPSLVNGLSTSPGSQSAETQGQGIYTGSALNPVQPSKNQSQPQQNMYSGQTPSSSKQMPSHFDNSNQNSSNHQKPQAHHKLTSQTQPTAQRLIQQNRQVNSDHHSKSQAREAETQQQLPVNMSSHIGTTCIDSTNITPVLSSSAPQRKSSEPPLTNSPGGEPHPPLINQALGQKQSLGSLPLTTVGHDSGSQRQRQEQPSPSQLQPPTLPPEQQSPQFTQLAQEGKNSLYVRPTN